jgi:hypothetical protein
VTVELGGGADALAELRLRFRKADEATFSTSLMNTAGTTASARIPLEREAEAYEVVYYVEGLAPSGTELAALGTSEEPLRFEVPASGAVALASTEPSDETEGEGGGLWWIGVAAGAAVAVAVVVTVVLLTRSDDPSDGSLGNIGLPLATF